MEKFRELAVKNPKIIGLILGILAGYAGYMAYLNGMTVAEFRAAHSDAAKAASEALGG